MSSLEDRVQIVAQAMEEYAQALRGDWSDFDGRSNKYVMEDFIVALTNPDSHQAKWDIARWRDSNGICPDTGTHWGGRWGFCHLFGCPTWQAQEAKA